MLVYYLTLHITFCFVTLCLPLPTPPPLVSTVSPWTIKLSHSQSDWHKAGDAGPVGAEEEEEEEKGKLHPLKQRESPMGIESFSSEAPLIYLYYLIMRPI